MEQSALEKTLTHVSRDWMPPHPKVLHKISTGFRSGAYRQKREDLIKDLKGDFSLYLYCLNKLRDSIPESNLTKLEQSTPFEIICAASDEELEKILCQRATDISPYTLENTNRSQAYRTQECILSASTTELLGETYRLDPALSFDTSVIRQLGLTLIAWNYPNVFATALSGLKSEDSLDIELQKVLGFSPSLLGAALARKWQLTDQLIDACEDVANSESADDKGQLLLPSESDNLDIALSKICEIGEALARAHNPNSYPTAANDWSKAHTAVTEALGPDATKKIYQQVQVNFQEYAALYPELTRDPVTTGNNGGPPNSAYASEKREANTYLRSCPDKLRKSLGALYNYLKPESRATEAIRPLMTEVVPIAGFVRGAIYLFDPTSNSLVPLITIGTLSPERMRPVKLTSFFAQSDVVCSAFSLKSPIRDEDTTAEGRKFSAIAGSIGTPSSVGVLYLESDGSDSQKKADEIMTIFRAIKHTLSDCLNVT